MRTGWNGITMDYVPSTGSYFAVVASTMTYYTAQIYTQGFTLSAGDVLSGYAALDARTDTSTPGVFSGEAFVEIHLDNGGSWWSWFDEQTLTSGPVEYWEWTAPTNGLYTLYYHVKHQTMLPGETVAVFDAQLFEGMQPIIPEPGTCALMLMGLAPLGAWLKRRRR